MNPWKERLGCEVNVCQAKQCDLERMRICALRKAYLERVTYFKLLRGRARSGIIIKRIDRVLEKLTHE